MSYNYSNFTVHTTLSEEKINNILQKSVNEWAQNYQNSIYTVGTPVQTTTSSSKGGFFRNLFKGIGDAASSFFNGVVGVGANVFSAALVNKIFGGGSSSSTSSTPTVAGTVDSSTISGLTTADLQKAIGEFDEEISKVQAKITTAESQLEKGSAETKTELDNEKTKLFGDGKNKTEKQENAIKIATLINEIQTSKNNIKTFESENKVLDGECGNLKTSISGLTTSKDELSSAASSTADETEKARYEKAVAEKDTLIKQKETDLKEKEAKIAQNKTQIESEYQNIDTKNTELEKLKSDSQFDKVNNYAKKEQEYQKYSDETDRAKLTASIAVWKQEVETLQTKKVEALQLYNAQVEQDAKNKNITNKWANQYASGDANDGNWWSRNMPTWLGGANKTTKAAQKANHAIKKEAKEALGGTNSSARSFTANTLAEIKYKDFSKYKNDKNQTIPLATFKSIVSGLGYNPSEDKIKQALKASGYTSG